MDLLFQKAAERGGYGGERYERVEFQKRVAEHYHSLRDSTWKVTYLWENLLRFIALPDLLATLFHVGYDINSTRFKFKGI